MRFLFVDRILELTPEKYIRGLKHITYDDYFLCFDEAGRLQFITSLIGEALGQLAAWNVMFSQDFILRPVAGLAGSAKVLRPAYVGETLLLESFIDHLDETAVQYHSIACIGEECVFTIDGALGPLLPMEDFIDRTVVRHQFMEINRPLESLDLPTTPCDIPMPATLSLAPPMQFDRILLHEPGVRLVAEKRVSRAAPYFPDHFPKKPVLPMTVLLECKINLAYEFVRAAGFPKWYRLQALRKVKMKEFIFPGDIIVSYLSVKSHQEGNLVLTYRTEVEGKRICVLDVIMVAEDE